MLEKSIPVLSQYTFMDNSLQNILEAVIVFGLLIGFFKLFQKFVLKRLKKLAQKTKSDIDDTLIQIFQSIKPPFYSFLAFYLALQLLFLGDFIKKAINVVLIVWVFYQVIIAVQIFIDYLIKKLLKKEKIPGTKAAYELVGKVLKGILWVFGVLLILSNLGINVNSLLAGLGIGGIAVAWAVRGIMSDLLCSFAIYFDKPFVVGDFIVVDKHMGVVEKIGLKTTRIKALQGEEIVFSNSKLTSSQVQNFKKLKERRIIFSFNVPYQTSTDKLKKIPEIIKKIVGSVKLTRFERVHCTEFNKSNLVFEVVYYMQIPDFMKYKDCQQQILIKIKDAFEQEGISLV